MSSEDEKFIPTCLSFFSSKWWKIRNFFSRTEKFVEIINGQTWRDSFFHSPGGAAAATVVAAASAVAGSGQKSSGLLLVFAIVSIWESYIG